MIRIDLGSEGLARTRFAVSPLHLVCELLYKAGHYPSYLPRTWQSRATTVVRENRLTLLAALATAGPVIPDFISPLPTAFDSDPHDQLHQVAITPTDRVDYEVASVLPDPGRKGTDLSNRSGTLLRRAMDRGEGDFAARVASQLGQFWDIAVGPHWTELHDQMHSDISRRAVDSAREGFHQMINGLGPSFTWNAGSLQLDFPLCDQSVSLTSQGVILVPSILGAPDMSCIDAPEAPGPRIPMITYPVAASPARSQNLGDLIGTTRAEILAELTQPQSTEGLAQRLHLSRATVSYHLQILHRAGLLQRTRRSRHVYYQRAAP
ncbi:ArsR/SmtB family transcription factor [Streptomyces sp. YS-3]|uniref:ArsR/SmtB family transcription factor n=1 Tax=Streptomyces sp. YS-3 TaxID=3381352 RepID=UPI003862D0F9